MGTRCCWSVGGRSVAVVSSFSESARFPLEPPSILSESAKGSIFLLSFLCVVALKLLLYTFYFLLINKYTFEYERF